jgi:hypothetical protein
MANYSAQDMATLAAAKDASDETFHGALAVQARTEAQRRREANSRAHKARRLIASDTGVDAWTPAVDQALDAAADRFYSGK